MGEEPSSTAGSQAAWDVYAVVRPYSITHEVLGWFSGLTSASSVAAKGVTAEAFSLSTTGFSAAVVKLIGVPCADSDSSLPKATRQNVYSVLPSRPLTVADTWT